MMLPGARGPGAPSPWDDRPRGPERPGLFRFRVWGFVVQAWGVMD